MGIFVSRDLFAAALSGFLQSLGGCQSLIHFTKRSYKKLLIIIYYENVTNSHIRPLKSNYNLKFIKITQKGFKIKSNDPIFDPKFYSLFRSVTKPFWQFFQRDFYIIFYCLLLPMCSSHQKNGGKFKHQHTLCF